MTHALTNDDHATLPDGDARECVSCVLLFWLGMQLAVLVVGALGVRFSARWPLPPQSFALHEMLIAQITCAAMLFPWLMRSWRTLLIIPATAWPFLVLAAMLAEGSSNSLLAAGLHVSVWLLTLGMFSLTHFLRSAHRQLFAVAIITMYAVGGACLSYLASEFGNSASVAGNPMVFTVAQIDRPFSGRVMWIVELAILALLSVISVWNHVVRRSTAFH